jgi:hypothetical protein
VEFISPRPYTIVDLSFWSFFMYCWCIKIRVSEHQQVHILEDALVLDLATLPPTRTRLWESVGLSRQAVKPRSTSADLSLENSSFTIRVVYFSDSRMASTFPSYTVWSSACKSFTTLSWSSYGRTSTLAFMLFTTTVNCWNRASIDSLGRCVKFLYSFSKSHTTVPRLQYSQHEHYLAPTKSYELGPLSEPDRIRIDTEHETSSRLPCCWRRACPSIQELGS